MTTTTAPQLRRAATAPARSSARRRPVDGTLAVASATLVSVLVAWGLTSYPLLGGDEGIYVEQAWAVTQGDISPYTYTYDHPFLGWVQIGALSWLAQALHLGGPLSVQNVRVVMLLVAFLSMLLTYGIARRLDLARGFAVVAVLVVGLSPLFVVYSRQVYLDNVAVLWVLVAVYLVLNRSQSQWAYGLGGTALAIGVLSKETAVLLAPAVAYLLWQRAWKPLRGMSVAFFLTLGATTLLIYPVFALLRSEFFPGPGHVSLLGDGILYQLSGRVSSGALWEPGSGRYVLLQQWLGYDSWLLLAGAGCAVLALGSRRLRFLGVAVLLWAVPVVRPSGYLPGMYVIAVLPFAGLAVAAVLDLAWRRVRSATGRLPGRWGRPAVGLAATAVVLAVGSALPAYLPGLRTAVTSDPVEAEEQAMAWVADNVPATERVLTDDVFFVDLARAGFATPWGAVSYYKYELDPQARTEIRGWRDVDVVLETPEMRRLAGTADYPRTAEVLANAGPVASFGSGDSQVVVRRVGVQPTTPPAPPAPSLPGSPLRQQALPGDPPEALAVLQRFADSADLEERRRLLEEYVRLTGGSR